MDRMRLHAGLYAVVIAAFSLIACSGVLPPAVELAGFETDFFNSRYAAHPVDASAQGLRQYDGSLDDLSSRGIGRRQDELARQLVRLLTLRAAELTPQEEIDGALMENAIRWELYELKHLRSWRTRPELYVDVARRKLERSARRRYASSSDRVKALVISINEIDALMAAMRANVEDPSATAMRRGINSCERLVAALRAELAEWGKEAAGVDSRLATMFSSGSVGAAEAVEQSLGWLRGQSTDSGAEEPPIGPENLVMAVLFDSMVETPLSELQRLAAANLERDYRALLEVAEQAAPGRDLAAALEMLAATGLSESELPAASLERINGTVQFLNAKGLVPLPEEVGVQKRYHAELRWNSLRSPFSPYFVDLPPAELGGREEPLDGYLVLSPPAPEWPAELKSIQSGQFSPEELQLEAAASIAPGRYLQALHTVRYPSRAGRLLGSRVTRDGWAHYAEHVVVDEGLGNNDPRLKLMLLYRAVVNDCRFVASIARHARGSSDEEIAALFVEWTGMDGTRARLEAERVSMEPMALAAALGKSLIRQLREDYRRAKGDAYSLRGFHEDFLRQGGLPIPLIRKELLGGT